MTTPPGWKVHAVAAGLQAAVTSPMLSLSTELDAEVERLWQAAQMRTGNALFNGRVFSVDAIAPARLTGHMTEFRRIVAQMDAPELRLALAVRPLAVCGVVACAGGILIGRREARAAYQAGMWQCPPAGSVDAGAVRADGSIDLEGHFFTELREEVGLERAQMQPLRPLCLVQHPGSQVLDLGYLAQTKLDAAAVLAAHAASGNREYRDVTVLPFEGLRARLDALGEELVPPARIFLGQLNWM